MAHVSATFDQRTFRFRNDNGNETAATWKAAANTPITQLVGEVFRLRVAYQETAGGAHGNASLTLQHNINNAGWANTTISSTGVRLAPSAHVSHNVATTSQLSGTSGTFLAGRFVSTGSPSTITYNGNDHTEMEYSLTLVAGQVSESSTIQFRVSINNTDPNSVTASPSLTVTASVPPPEYEWAVGQPVTTPPAPPEPSIIDDTGLTDSIEIQLEQSHTRNTDNNLALEDTLEQSSLYEKEASDELETIDHLDTLYISNRTQADDLELTDDIIYVVELAHESTQTHDIELTDSHTIDVILERTTTDDILLTDDLDVIADSVFELEEEAQLTDTVEYLLEGFTEKELTDSVGLVDEVAIDYEGAHARENSDDVTLQDIADYILDYGQELTDDLDVEDVIEIDGSTQVQQTDPLDIEDDISMDQEYNRILEDDTGISDTETREYNSEQLFTEDIMLSDDIDRVSTTSVLATDSLELLDNISTISTQAVSIEIESVIGLSDELTSTGGQPPPPVQYQLLRRFGLEPDAQRVGAVSLDPINAYVVSLEVPKGTVEIEYSKNVVFIDEMPKKSVELDATQRNGVEVEDA